jgi:hypothetical protein
VLIMILKMSIKTSIYSILFVVVIFIFSFFIFY